LRRAIERKEPLFAGIPGYTGLGVGWEGPSEDGRYVVEVLLEDATIAPTRGLPARLDLDTERGRLQLPIRFRTVGIIRLA